MHDRAEIEVETLLKVVLLLVAVWLVIEIVTEILGFVAWALFGLLQPVLGLLIVALIVLWLLDRI